MENNFLTEKDYQRILDMIDPATTNRQTWVEVGMALKSEGLPFSMFDKWSARDSRPKQYQGTYKTEKAWDSFQSAGVTGATLVYMARERGLDPFPKQENEPINLNDFIYDEPPMRGTPHLGMIYKNPEVTDHGKKPVFQTIDFLEAVFDYGENPNVLSTNFLDPNDNKYKPMGLGIFSWKTEEYVNRLKKNADSPEALSLSIGSYTEDCGVWVRINPVNPETCSGKKGVANSDITAYRNALIECDELTIDEQMEKIKELKIPYVSIVHSGGKSLHVIVRIDAKSLADYQNKVAFLYDYCKTHDFPIDTQNKNPSRLSRLPGVKRGNNKQFLVDANPDPIDFEVWEREVKAQESAKDIVIKNFGSVLEKGLPELRPELIEGVLRRGHKMIIAGKSKSAKSFALIQMAVACAEGTKWLGTYKIKQGRALYINLEIDEASFYGRMAKVYEGMGVPVSQDNLRNSSNIDVITLRGRSKTMDVLIEELKYKVESQKYDIIIIDPIYKVITGDENNASEMAKFCGYFDRLAETTGAAIVYAHHHSKGNQSAKNAIDRASGSGVFARDPDAICDLMQLDLNQDDQEKVAEKLLEIIDKNFVEKWKIILNDKDEDNPLSIRRKVEANFKWHQDEVDDYETQREEAIELSQCDAFRIEFTLREFKGVEDKNVFWKYPVHRTDPTGILEECYLEGERGPEVMKKAREAKAKKQSDKKRKWLESVGGFAKIADMMKEFDCSRNTIKKWADEQDDIERESGTIRILFDSEEDEED